MFPRRTLTVAVTFTALVVAAAWVILYRQQVLVPALTVPTRGPSFAEVAREFDAILQQFPPPSFGTITSPNPATTAPAPSSSAASDDPVLPPSAAPPTRGRRSVPPAPR